MRVIHPPVDGESREDNMTDRHETCQSWFRKLQLLLCLVDDDRTSSDGCCRIGGILITGLSIVNHFACCLIPDHDTELIRRTIDRRQHKLVFARVIDRASIFVHHLCSCINLPIMPGFARSFWRIGLTIPGTGESAVMTQPSLCPQEGMVLA